MINFINKNIVIITSKIYTSKNKLSYIANRSIYTYQERFNQTLKTIETIKNKIPNYYIILIDNSIFPQNEFNKLNNSVDKFINITNNDKLNYYTDECIYKGYGELAQLYNILDILKNIDFNINNIFKISGRYLISNNFKYTIYDNDKNIFKINNNIKNRKYIYTCFYKIKYLKDFIDKIQEIYNIISTSIIYDNIDLEVFLPPFFIQNTKYVNFLGIIQNIAVWKNNTII
jgi:hypothetical protein